jgi:hypothetical protein
VFHIHVVYLKGVVYRLVRGITWFCAPTGWERTSASAGIQSTALTDRILGRPCSQLAYLHFWGFSRRIAITVRRVLTSASSEAAAMADTPDRGLDPDAISSHPVPYNKHVVRLFFTETVGPGI